ncbi:unnamed protein product [Ectocarpus sp. 12 AP-2014]
MPADAGSAMAAAAAAAVPDTKPLTPRSILRREGCASSGAVEGAPRKRVTFEESVSDDKPSSGGKKLRRRAGGGAAARAAARRTGHSRLGSLLLPSYAASPASSSGSGYSPPSTVASRATTSYDVRAPGRVRQAGCYPWPNAPHSSSSSTVESPGGGRRVLCSAVAAGPTKSRGRRMFQVQEEMNRAERKAVAAAAAAAVAASASSSGSPASSAVTAAAKCLPEQQRRLERQQQQRRRQEGVRPRSSTGGGSPVAAAAVAAEASAPPPDSRLTPPVSSRAAAVVSASTTSQTHLAPPSSQQQQQEQQQLRGGRGEDEPPSHPAAMATAAATVVVEIDEQLPRQRPGPTAERPPSRPTERDATGSTDSTGSSCASPHAEDGAGGGGDWAGTGPEADGRPELRYREYAAGVSITSPPARTAPAKEEEEAAGVVGPTAALEVSSNEGYPLAPSGATPAAGGNGSKEDEPRAAGAIQRASGSTTTVAAASPARVEAGGTADNTCDNAEDGSDDLTAGSPLKGAVAMPSGSDSIEPFGSQEHSRRVATESKSTWTSPKCLAEIGDVALGTTPWRSQHVPPVVTPPSDDQPGRTFASRDAASGGSDRDDAINDNDRASAGRASGCADAADGGRMGDGGSNKRGSGANTVGSRGRYKRARIDKQQSNHAGSGERGESTGGVAAPSGAVCSSPPANRQRHPVVVDASPPSTASPSPCSGTTVEPCLGHDEDGGGGRPRGDGRSPSPSLPPLLPPLPPLRQEQEPEIEFPASRLLPAAAAAAAVPKVPPADKTDAAPPSAEPTEIVAEEEEGRGEPICASGGEVEENHGAAAVPSPVRAAEVIAIAQRSANGKRGGARTVASGRGRLPARFVGSCGASAAAAVAGGGGDDNKGRHKRLKRPSRKMLEVREGNEEEEEGVVKQRPPASASCAPAAVGGTPGTAAAAAAAKAANAASVPPRAAGTRESSRGGENPTAATAAAAAAAAADVVSAVEVGPRKKRRKRSNSVRGLPATPTPLTAGGAVDPSPLADKAGRPQAKAGARRRKKDGGGGGASRSGGKSQGSTTAAKHRMREGHAYLLRKAAVAPRSAPEPSAEPLAKPGRRMVPSPARTRSSSVAAPPAATGKVATARVKTAEVSSGREESSGTVGVANGDVPAPTPVAASSWTGWMAPRSPRQPVFLPSQQPAVSAGSGGSRDAEHEAAVVAPAAGGVSGWMGLLSSGWKGLLSKAAGRSGS